MQGQRGALGSFSEPLGFEHGSTSNDVVESQIHWEDNIQNSPSDYISLNTTGQESPNANMWNVDEPSSSSGPNVGESFSDNPFGPSYGPFELDDHRLTRKRKASELSIGQSSSDPIIPRLGINVNRASSENPFAETANQNVNLRINEVLPTNSNNNPEPENSGQPVLRIPSLRRNYQTTSRWTRSSASRINRPSSSNLVLPGDRNDAVSRSAPPVNNGGTGTATSQAGPSSLYNSRRLSALLRRSLLSSTDLETSGGQNGNIFPRIPTPTSSSSSNETPPVSIHQQPHLRSSLLVGRQLDGGGLGVPRRTTAVNVGRGRLVSEIRNVLDLMRRGEPLRFEDLMLLDQSVFFGISDMHDRHRDMRLDIDNMSYEELLALEERIGNVNTGLTEEKISKHLKQKQYVLETGRAAEPCCVCQEEYKEGDDLGKLECGHEFHHGCIKQWLQQKNSCPICKSTGFANT